MKISTKGRYALRFMIELAQNTSGMPMSLKDVALRQNISDKYLEQIILVLYKSGLVTSVRGMKGGYLLTKEPEEYTVGMILRSTEGSLAPVACVDKEVIDCERLDGCATVVLWKKINDAINDVVDHVTLKDLVDWQNRDCERTEQLQ